MQMCFSFIQQFPVTPGDNYIISRCKVKIKLNFKTHTFSLIVCK